MSFRILNTYVFVTRVLTSNLYLEVQGDSWYPSIGLLTCLNNVLHCMDARHQRYLALVTLKLKVFTHSVYKSPIIAIQMTINTTKLI